MFFEDHLRDVEEPSSLQTALRTRNSSNAPTSTATRDGALCVERLVQATTNERQCPEVLPYPADVIDRIVALLLAQQRKIEALTQEEMEEAARQPFGGTSLLPFKPSDLLRLETQRLQFFLSELLRCRLRKIEALCQAIYYEGQLESGELAQQRAGGAAAFSMNELNAVKYPQRANLSPNERIVADRLALSSHHAVQQAGLQFAPTELQHLTPHQPYGEGAEILPQPRISSYVFGWVLQDLGVVRLIEGTEQDVHAEDLFLVPYAALRPHVIAGQVRLV